MPDSNDVLLVDADACALGLMAQGLTRQGLRVRSATGSEEALASLSAQAPSLVISDVEPSGADGLRILEALRRNPRTAEIPMLLLAKGEWTRRQEEAKQLGAQGLLKKPLFVQDVAVLGRLHAGHAAAEETFTGELGDVRCPWLVRGLLSGGRSGQLSFDPAGGRIYFRDGCVIDAVLPPLSGERALWRMLTFERGRYRIRYGEVDRSQTLAIDGRDLQSRGFEHARRWAELKDALGPLDARLEVDYRRLSDQLEALPPAVWPLLRLFDGHRTVAQAIDDFGVDDHVGAQAVVKLNGLGLLRPAGPRLQDPLQLTDVIDTTASAAVEAFFAEQAQRETFEAAAAAAAQAQALELSDSEPIPGLVPEGVALALGQDVPEAQAPVAGVADGVESDFFASTNASATLEAPLPATRPAAVRPPATQFILSAMAAMAVVAVAALLWPHPHKAPKPLPESRPLPKILALPPAPSPAAVRSAEIAEVTKLIEQGQNAYDHRDYAGAESSFAQAVNQAPDNAVAQTYLGLVDYEEGQLTAAVDPLEKARALDPQNERAELLLGADYQELGKRDLARDRYEEYLKLQPRGEYAHDVRAILTRLATRR